MSFFGRVIQWLAQDILVRGLAGNKSFQRMVLKIDSFVNSGHKVITEKGGEYLKAGTKIMNEKKTEILKDKEVLEAKKALEETLKQSPEIQKIINSFSTTISSAKKK